MSRSAEFWIEHLGLAAHPEGGHYRETYRAEGRVRRRAFSTAIYFLLRTGERSWLHRLRSDEVFHHYRGSALTIHVLHTDGAHETIQLGADPDRHETLQAMVPAGSWFGAEVETAGSYALVGCTVSPGFEFEDFELAERAKLLDRFPDHREIVERLTP